MDAHKEQRLGWGSLGSPEYPRSLLSLLHTVEQEDKVISINCRRKDDCYVHINQEALFAHNFGLRGPF